MVWRFNQKIRSMPVGKILRIETLTSATIHWSADEWETVQNAATRDTGLGIHTVDIATDAVPEGQQIKFTFHWSDSDRWEGADFMVRIVSLESDTSATAEKSEANG
jgi:glucoamylase